MSRQSIYIVLLIIYPFHQTIKQYLIDNDGGSVLRELTNTGSLIDSSRKKLIHICTDLLVKVYGINPTKPARLKFASTMTQMFPFLSVVSKELVERKIVKLRHNNFCMLFAVNIFLGIW